MSDVKFPAHLEVSVPAALGSLRLVTGLTRRCLADAAGLLPRDPVFQQVQLAIREACTNVVRHAYAGRPEGELRLRLEVRDGGIHIEIEDEGVPLDAARLNDRSRRAPRENDEPAEGGYGLSLIRQTMDRVIYVQDGRGANLVRLYKKLDKAA